MLISMRCPAALIYNDYSLRSDMGLLLSAYDDSLHHLRNPNDVIFKFRAFFAIEYSYPFDEPVYLNYIPREPLTRRLVAKTIFDGYRLIYDRAAGKELPVEKKTSLRQESVISLNNRKIIAFENMDNLLIDEVDYDKDDRLIRLNVKSLGEAADRNSDQYVAL